MKKFDFKKFNQNVLNDLSIVSTLIDNAQNIRFSRSFSNEEYEMDCEQIAEILSQAKLKILFAYDYLRLEKMSDLLEKELEKHEGKFNRLSELWIADVLYSPVLLILQNHLNAITSHIEVESDEENEPNHSRKLLERILRGTSKILTDRKIEPSNESDVRNAVYGLLIHIFPDTVKDIPIAKVSKTYKPDIGIKKIKSAVEYKFICSEAEAKTAIEGVFADIKGYEGSNDWKTFYAVFYMTGHFYTQDQVEADFEISNVPHKWKPIVVYGNGERKKRSKTS